MKRSTLVVEYCWTLVGQRQGRFWYARRRLPTRGQPVRVEFDAGWALRREERKGDVVGFYHTHPGGSPNPSQRDVFTIHAWTACFGKPLLCLIESDGQLAGYRFDSDESDGDAITACELFPRGLVVAYDDGDVSHGK